MIALANVPNVVTVRCHYCSRQRSQREVISIGTGGAIMCWVCYDWHKQALEMLAGNPPSGCQVCGVTYTQLQERSPGGDSEVGMFVHQKDGLYQVLCRACSDAYELQRVDLYRPTQFGFNKKL